MADSSSQDVIHLIVLVLIAGNIFAAVVGVLMIIAPARLASWSRVSDRWVSTRPLTEPLDQTRDLDSRVLRRPRAAGIMMFAGAVFILFQGVLFARRTSVGEGGRLLSEIFAGSGLPLSAWETLWLSLLAFLLLGAVLALVVGALAIFNSSLLSRLSRQANRWVSTGGGVKALDAPHYGFDSIVRSRPRVWGVVITLLAVYVLIVLFWFWRPL